MVLNNNPPVDKLTLCQDDFIEWVLRNTQEETEFRIYKSHNYMMVGINRKEPSEG